MSVRTTETILNVLIVCSIIGLVYVVGYPQYKESRDSAVNIGVDASFASLPYYIAQVDTSRRYFKLEKIRPQFIEIAGRAIDGIKRGDYDIATVPWIDLLASPGIDGDGDSDTLKVLASIKLKAVSDAIIVPRKSRIRTIKDLEGKKLGYLEAEESMAQLVCKIISEQLMTRFTAVSLKPDEITAALKNNKVDALYVLEPLRSFMVCGGDTILAEGFISRYISPTLPYMAIVMKKSFVRENRLAAFRLKNAVDAALGYLRVHPEAGKAILVTVKNWPSDGMLLLNMRMPEYERLPEIDTKGIESFQSFLVRNDVAVSEIKPLNFLFEKTDFVR